MNDKSQFPGTEICLQKDFFQTHGLFKSKKRQHFGFEAKIDKSKTTLFSQTFKVPGNTVPLFF